MPNDVQVDSDKGKPRVGMGMCLDWRDGEVVVWEVIPESSAERMGVQVGDVLLMCDGLSQTFPTHAQFFERWRYITFAAYAEVSCVFRRNDGDDVVVVLAVEPLLTPGEIHEHS